MLSTGVFRLCGCGVTSAHQKEPRLLVILHHTEIWISGASRKQQRHSSRVWARYYQCIANKPQTLETARFRKVATCWSFGWTGAHGSLPAGQDTMPSWRWLQTGGKMQEAAFQNPGPEGRLGAQTRLCVHFRMTSLSTHFFLPYAERELRGHLRLGASRWRERTH